MCARVGAEVDARGGLPRSGHERVREVALPRREGEDAPAVVRVRVDVEELRGGERGGDRVDRFAVRPLAHVGDGQEHRRLRHGWNLPPPAGGATLDSTSRLRSSAVRAHHS